MAVTLTQALMPSSEAAPSDPPAATPQGGISYSTPTDIIGIDLSSGFYDTNALAAAKQRWPRLNLAQAFVSWGYEGHDDWANLNVRRVQAVAALGLTPEISWDPVKTGSTDQSAYSFRAILAGRQDAYIKAFAQAAKQVGSPLIIRFAHEMNLKNSPFSETQNGNQPGEFVKVWKYVNTMFKSVGVTNVRWMWSPNIVGVNTAPLKGLYPGDAFVDMVGIDGYSYPLEGCRDVATVFGGTIQQVRALTSRPMTLAEVGISEACPNKAKMVVNFLQWYGSKTQDLAGFTWWNRQDANDWRIDSSTTSAAAFAASWLSR